MQNAGEVRVLFAAPVIGGERKRHGLGGRGEGRVFQDIVCIKQVLVW
jgi:hypothetical protein